ncbi:glycoside hydrolase family 25 protein [Chitinophagaceae bacterium MMS25-I14]
MADYIKGIDVSRWQGTDINWKQVKADGNSFVFIKVTDGSAYKEAFIDIGRIHAKGAVAAGLKIGYYHFSHPANHGGLEEDATAEARYLLATLKKDFPKPNFPLVLDFEDENMSITPAEAEKWIATFCAVLKKAGYEMIYYSYKGYSDSHLPTVHSLGNLPLWLASYPKNFDINNPPKSPRGWQSWVIWQYSEKGTVKGINSSGTDLNIMTKDFFNKY